MNVTIFGATGMVGIEVLHRCLDENRFQRVVSIGRSSTGEKHPKLREIEHADFTDYTALESELAETDICLYCLGVYQGQVSSEKFWEITCDYLTALLRAFEKAGPDITFCLFSAQGADPGEKSPILFAKVKGRAEFLFMESEIARKYIFRPGYIHPGRKESRSRVPAWVVVPVYKLFPCIGIDAADLAGVMVHVSLHGHDKAVLENKDIRALAHGAG
jgi:nucleoside-diphosphate-sugar epimerase